MSICDVGIMSGNSGNVTSFQGFLDQFMLFLMAKGNKFMSSWGIMHNLVALGRTGYTTATTTAGQTLFATMPLISNS